MLKSNLTKQITYVPLIAIFVMGLLGQSRIDRSHEKQIQMGINSSLAVAGLGKHIAVKVAQTTSGLDEKVAQNLVWKLPQVQRKAREIQKLSKGSIWVASVVDSSPTADAPYYAVRVFENHPNKTTDTIYWFRVLSPSGVIEALDLVKNEYIPLAKWNPDGR
ncbi:hypothetical protein [Cylindrospermum sp. FACHB-282]|uniref:hypothetical protein n=1 Tax=Cylindrospermum sp. FACHB-282 TaxID=2692794 RepID=UPI0016866CF1|nr:hypothetical protein [Cylindrospermum sp. FACHB-282]MBD2386896.1 hypothetical protein [Cylindrospermum sp. FACHB-282]